MAGDEKVYVSQAIEMAEHGRWFVQTLQGVPDYYKGPLHYILLRIGMLVFGWNPWAVLYMNFMLILGGAWALGALIRRYCGGDQANGLAVWTGAFFATCTGIYAHTFASQMEAELAGLFAIAFYVLDSTPVESGGFLFWTLAGLIGWSKSPLHAVFAGASAILFWLVNGELPQRLRNWKSWCAAFFGIAVCTAGYLPAFLFDRENFVQFYLVRETLDKGDSGQSWFVSYQSVLGFYLFPWLLIALVCYADFFAKLVRPWKRFFDPKIRRAYSLAICGIFPSFAFFTWHPYHFENYDLPVISGVVFFIGLVFGTRLQGLRWVYRMAALLTAVILLVLPVGLTALSIHFAPLPAWWPSWLVPLAWGATAASCFGLIYFGTVQNFKSLQWVAFSMVGFLIVMGSTVTTIGERELFDLRQFLKTPAGQNARELGYYNLQHNIWSEWGLLNFWIHRKVVGLHEPAQLKQALTSGEVILVPARQPQRDFRDFIKKELPDLPLEIIPWKRWLTQGKSESGQSLWKEAWDRRDIGILETDYLIVRRK
jgi:4-amino-4-deoxy-L-arabinose transferase-like glycosyltransferase